MSVELIFDFNPEKNAILKKERDISFEEVIATIEAGEILDVVAHPNKKRYPRQKIYYLRLRDYVYLVPFVRDGQVIFLKTIIPSRKMTKYYLGRQL